VFARRSLSGALGDYRIRHEMSNRLYDPAAPWTVRAGATSLALSCVLGFFWQGSMACVGDWGRPSLWDMVLRPLLSLSVGLSTAWGIARMRAMFYWFFVVGWLAILFAMAIVVAATRSGLSTPRMSGVVDTLGALVFVTWLIAFGLLVSRPSLRAFWARPGPLSRPGTGVA